MEDWRSLCDAEGRVEEEKEDEEDEDKEDEEEDGGEVESLASFMVEADALEYEDMGTGSTSLAEDVSVGKRLESRRPSSNES
ncbi:hypothetical protein MKZ38_008820 [Zalerion maritima]|uniref:Uncharacterized protein n=1 Tax=Zalerion maritima TaxID=339359 RepID=A0AAD5WTS8_9PEZI|nr:hypothetical protein MKZ38_008820 [Zalerion maritima]